MIIFRECHWTIFCFSNFHSYDTFCKALNKMAVCKVKLSSLCSTALKSNTIFFPFIINVYNRCFCCHILLVLYKGICYHILDFCFDFFICHSCIHRLVGKSFIFPKLSQLTCPKRTGINLCTFFCCCIFISFC